MRAFVHYGVADCGVVLGRVVKGLPLNKLHGGRKYYIYNTEVFMSKKNNTQNESTGNTGTLEASKDWLDKSAGAKVQNPNQNKEIHKQGMGRNAGR